jgi:putative AdoMet-dependent methyltransferase
MTSKYTPTPQEFDDWAPSYDRDVVQGDGLFPFDGYSQVLDEVARLAQVRAGTAVLDLGTGTGELARRFLPMGAQVYGLDFSPRMLAAAQARFPQLRLVRADLLGDWQAALQTAFERNRFGALVSGYAFHHFDLQTKLSLLVRLAAEHLEPGGRMVFGDIAFADASALAVAQQRWADLWEDEDYWIADETLSACRAAGLQAAYQQISSCGGVFAIQRVADHADKAPL